MAWKVRGFGKATFVQVICERGGLQASQVLAERALCSELAIKTRVVALEALRQPAKRGLGLYLLTRWAR